MLLINCINVCIVKAYLLFKPTVRFEVINGYLKEKWQIIACQKNIKQINLHDKTEKIKNQGFTCTLFPSFSFFKIVAAKSWSNESNDKRVT